jgi:multiple sugar transport system ATP-binding protein
MLGRHPLGVGAETLAARPALRAHDGQSVTVGIRPEDFEDATLAPDTPADRRIHATVTLVEALGSEVMVHFALDARTVDAGDPDAPEEAVGEMQSNAVGRFSPRSRVRIGDAIEIALSTENLHFFDTATGAAIWG